MSICIDLNVRNKNKIYVSSKSFTTKLLEKLRKNWKIELRIKIETWSSIQTHTQNISDEQFTLCQCERIEEIVFVILIMGQWNKKSISK